MKRKRLLVATALAWGTLTLVTSAQTTIFSEDFEGYTNGTSLTIPGWIGNASNVTAVVTNDGSGLVCDFSGFAKNNGSDNYNLIGVDMRNVAFSNNISPFMSDYTLSFDLAKIAGTNSWETQVELDFPGGSLLRYDVTDPSAGTGFHHFSVNMSDYTSSEGSLPSIDSLTNVDVTVKYWGPGSDAGPVYTEYQVDNIGITMAPGPFYLGTHSPTGAQIGLDQTISASVVDLGTEVNSMLLYLDGETAFGQVGYTGGSTTNMISYDAMGLSVGVHNVRLEVSDISFSTNRNYRWDFYVATNGPTIPIGFEGFESYSTGTWNAATAPAANPSIYVNGSTPQYANIVDEGGSNQVLQLDLNLSNMWQVGIGYDLDLGGQHMSKDISDYSLQFYLRVPPETAANLPSSSFFLSVYDSTNSLVGSQYSIATLDPTGFANAINGGGLISIPLGEGTLAAGASKIMDGSAKNWRVKLRIDASSAQADLPVTLMVDNMVVNYTEPTFMNATWAPTGVTGQDPTISVTVYDGTEEVDSMDLYIDGGPVAYEFYTGGSITNTISYDWIGAPVGVHTGLVIVASASLYAETNSWTFTVPEPPPKPSNNPLELYNINFSSDPDMGNGSQHYQPVPDGYIAAAPPLGSNNWLNAIHDPWWWPNGTSYAVNEASGTSAKSIIYNLLLTSSVISMQVPWSWGSQDWVNTTTNTMWATCFGGTPVNVDLQLSGVETNGTYDLYLYYVNPEGTAPATTTYTITTGSAPYPELMLTSTQGSVLVSGSYTNLANFVENENYVVITGISPSSGGVIGLNVSADTGGLSAMQLVKRGVDIVIPQPSIQSLIVVADTATVTWGTTNGMSYSVLSTTNLVDGPWTVVTNGIPGNDAETWMNMPVTSDHKFFKIQAELQR